MSLLILVKDNVLYEILLLNKCMIPEAYFPSSLFHVLAGRALLSSLMKKVSKEIKADAKITKNCLKILK